MLVGALSHFNLRPYSLGLPLATGLRTRSRGNAKSVFRANLSMQVCIFAERKSPCIQSCLPVRSSKARVNKFHESVWKAIYDLDAAMKEPASATQGTWKLNIHPGT